MFSSTAAIDMITHGRNNGEVNDSRGPENVESKFRSQSNSGIAVEANANGRAVLVHAGDNPHLISLGSNRFSIAVTVHPLPEGRTVVGNNSKADIVINGHGVEQVHCWIDNDKGIVTILPSHRDAAVLVDGKKVEKTTRLRQGCMLCLGRSNFFRFNHPQEAKFMKSLLPTDKISKMSNTFCSNVDSQVDDAAQNWLDSWCQEICSSSNDHSSNSFLLPNETPKTAEQVSQKTILPDNPAFSTPASVSSSQLKLPSEFHDLSLVYKNGMETYDERAPWNGDKNNNEQRTEVEGKIDDRVEDTLSENQNHVSLNGCESLLMPKPKIIPPCPAFNRNPSYVEKKDSSPVNEHGSFIPSPSFSSSQKFASSQHPAFPAVDQIDSGSSHDDKLETGSVCAENGFRKSDFEIKRKQARNNRLLEQERVRVEQLRLEEVLTACADYEKQAQFDRSNKSHVRIKTNGSLSRDKTPMSPMFQTQESLPNSSVFTFDNNESCTNSENSQVYEKVTHHSGLRTRIRTVPSPKVVRKNLCLELINCRLDALQEGTNNCPVSSDERNHVDSKKCDSSMPGDNTMYQKKYEFTGVDPTTTNTNKSLVQNNGNTLMSQSYDENLGSNKITDCKTDSMSVSCIDFSDERSHQSNSEIFSSNEYSQSKTQLSAANVSDNNNGLEKLNKLVSELNNIVQKSPFSKLKPKNEFLPLLDSVPIRKENSKFILPLEEMDGSMRMNEKFSDEKYELKKLENEQCRLLTTINDVKNKLLDIQRQKDEIIGELEIEKALLEGELKSKNDELTSEEQRLGVACENIRECEKSIEQCSKDQAERQKRNETILKEQHDILDLLQTSLFAVVQESDKVPINESMKKNREILDEEIKSFEDFEFRSLELEASLLSRKDDLLGELNKISEEIERTRHEISALYTQKESLLQNASDEIRSLEIQVRSHTRTLQLNYYRLQEIGVHLSSTSKSFECMTDENANSNNKCFFHNKIKSQEDLDRISSVTSDPPILGLSSSNSLGRRNIDDVHLKVFVSEKNEIRNKFNLNPNAYFTNIDRCKSIIDKPSGMFKERLESRHSLFMQQQPLSLFEHIESAGHLLALCPQVSIDKTSCRGYLQKMTSKFRSWKKRWFVFDRVKCSFSYYSDKNERKLKEEIHFRNLVDLCMTSGNSIRSPTSQATFIVKSTERVFYLLAPSIEAMRIWFDVLATEIETYKN